MGVEQRRYPFPGNIVLFDHRASMTEALGSPA
jgi:hypothetical protein